MNILAFGDRVAGKWFDWRMSRAVQKEDMPELLSFERMTKDKSTETTWLWAEVATWAERMTALMDAESAPNYLEFTLQPRLDREIPPVNVTIRRYCGKSPAQVADKLRNELAVKDVEISDLRTELKYAYEIVRKDDWTTCREEPGDPTWCEAHHRPFPCVYGLAAAWTEGGV